LRANPIKIKQKKTKKKVKKKYKRKNKTLIFLNKNKTSSTNLLNTIELIRQTWDSRHENLITK